MHWVFLSSKNDEVKIKEILSNNPYIVDLIEYENITTMVCTADDVAELKRSLQKQQENICVSKFKAMEEPRKEWQVKPEFGKFVDLKRSDNIIHVIR